jgi:hypothetical protein
VDFQTHYNSDGVEYESEMVIFSKNLTNYAFFSVFSLKNSLGMVYEVTFAEKLTQF